MRGFIISSIALCLAGVAIAQTAKPNATVTLKRLIEKRELSFDKTPFSGWENGIELTLHIDGADVGGARKYGKLKATAAMDDAGTDLTKKGEGPSNSDSSFHEVREPQVFHSGFDIE